MSLVSIYNKINAIKNALTVITRFLLGRVSRLLIAWIKDIILLFKAI